MDSIVGKDGRGAIVTLVERKTDYMMMRKLHKGKDAIELAKTVNEMLRPFKRAVLTITTDNGTEFAEHLSISRHLNTKIFFADPYSSCQKGNIEHTNKLIRQYIPKKTNFDTIDDKFIQRIQYKINRRPRKNLNFITPVDCFFENFY